MRRYPSLRTQRTPCPSGHEWLLFAAQALVVVLVDVCNDILRGNIIPPNSAEAIHNAHRIVAFETAHGFFIEPGWQLFFRHAHHLLGLTVTWSDVVRVANTLYGFCHIAVTLLIGAWIYARHRDHFPFVRNVMLATNALALATYELFPMAPPRLTPGLVFHQHAFRFQDSMQHVIGDGKLNGIPIGYNPYSAMPSVHAAWAIIMGLSLLWLARTPVLRLLGAIYPTLMIWAIVLTANHYLLDAVGGALAVSTATGVVLVLGRVRSRLSEQAHVMVPAASVTDAPVPLMRNTTACRSDKSGRYGVKSRSSAVPAPHAVPNTSPAGRMPSWEHDKGLHSDGPCAGCSGCAPWTAEELDGTAC